jgi:hypothetical protein
VLRKRVNRQGRGPGAPNATTGSTTTANTVETNTSIEGGEREITGDPSGSVSEEQKDI